MTQGKHKAAGNVLGELTAEADDVMLKAAFYESRNYLELLNGRDFRFVVGRRGTGKSALFRKVTEAMARDSGILLLTERPREEKARAFQHDLGQLSDKYSDARLLTRLTWKVQVLTQAADAVLENNRSTKFDVSKLHEYRGRHGALFKEKGLSRSLEALRQVVAANPGVSVGALAERLASHYQFGWLESQVTEALKKLNRRAVFLYDGLDEGWMPNSVATGILGGLAMAAVDFRESQGIHCLVFVRDNMFRALAEFDGDYTRNIEGNTLRLHWDEQSLLTLIALRLRTAFGWAGENNVKAWNRFAQRDLHGIEGFRKCLRLTLYRPRDLIALFNAAYQISCGQERDSLIDEDVEATASRISKARLNDLGLP